TPLRRNAIPLVVHAALPWRIVLRVDVMPRLSLRPSTLDLIGPQRGIGDVLTGEKIGDIGGASVGEEFFSDIGDGAVAEGSPASTEREEGREREESDEKCAHYGLRD